MSQGERSGASPPFMTKFLQQTWLVLLLAVVLGLTLAVAERSLEGKIERNAEMRLQKAILGVIPQGARSEPELLAGRAAYRVSDADGRLIGWAVPAETMGFQDRIQLLIGFSADGQTIQGLSILEAKETPGLGDKIRDDEFCRQFARQPSGTRFHVVKPGQSAGHPIHAISGATISTKAVTDAVNEEILWVREAIASWEGGSSSEGDR